MRGTNKLSSFSKANGDKDPKGRLIKMIRAKYIFILPTVEIISEIKERKKRSDVFKEKNTVPENLIYYLISENTNAQLLQMFVSKKKALTNISKSKL